jgi:hypothetical protein
MKNSGWTIEGYRKEAFSKLNLVDVIKANNYIGLEWMINNKKVDLSNKVKITSYVDSQMYMSPLMYAAMWRADKCLKIILDNIPAEKIDETSVIGKTALMYAAENGYTECVHLLVEFGADLRIKDKNGKTAYDLAVARECYFERCQFVSEFKSDMSEIKNILADAMLSDAQENEQQVVELAGEGSSHAMEA